MNWFCLHTKPKRENHVVERLSDQLGLEVFSPRLHRVRKIRRVRREISEPLFPRYVFCRFSLATNFRAVRFSHDVLDVLSFGATPIVVSDALIADLRNWTTEAGRLVPMEPCFSAGDKVEVAKGPFQGLQAVIMEDRGENDRVAALLWILGNETRVNIARGELVKIA